MTSQPATTMSEVVQPQQVPAEAVPATPAKSSGKTGPQGMPAGYSGREVQDPDDIEMKHAGNSSYSTSISDSVALSCSWKLLTRSDVLSAAAACPPNCTCPPPLHP